MFDKDGLERYLYPNRAFTPQEESEAKVFMVLGQTGCGKSTLLNAMLNFVLGVKIEDNFRFNLVDEDRDANQAWSQTNLVNIYNIGAQNGYPAMKIIDTPGFADTAGLKRDKEIFKQIAECFEQKLTHIDGILFVVKSTDSRLSVLQRYVLNEVQRLFGKDVARNIVMMFTFCDGGDINALSALRSDEDFVKVSKKFVQPNNLKFNNSGIFKSLKAKGQNKTFTRSFFELGMSNF